MPTITAAASVLTSLLSSTATMLYVPATLNALDCIVHVFVVVPVQMLASGLLAESAVPPNWSRKSTSVPVVGAFVIVMWHVVRPFTCNVVGSQFSSTTSGVGIVLHVPSSPGVDVEQN